jgi:transposase-like protein
MRNRAKSREAKQAGGGLLLAAQQLLLPMIEGMARSKQALLEWVQQVGLSALGELFERDAEQLAGPKGKHSKERSHYRWGSAPAELPLGGRRIVVNRPRVRNLVGGEEQLPTVEHFQRIDPVPARVLNQILLGVSTRGYEKSLEPPPVGVAARGTSKSAASRQLIARMTDQLREQLTRRLDQLDLLVLMLDGVEVARRTVVVALGILADGRKVSSADSR